VPFQKMLTAKETAKRLGVNYNKVLTSLRTGKVDGIDAPPCILSGHKRFYKSSDVDDALIALRVFNAQYLDKPAVCVRFRITGDFLNYVQYQSGKLYGVPFPDPVKFSFGIRWKAADLDAFEAAVVAKGIV